MNCRPRSGLPSLVHSPILEKSLAHFRTLCTCTSRPAELEPHAGFGTGHRGRQLIWAAGAAEARATEPLKPYRTEAAEAKLIPKTYSSLCSIPNLVCATIAKKWSHMSHAPYCKHVRTDAAWRERDTPSNAYARWEIVPRQSRAKLLAVGCSLVVGSTEVFTDVMRLSQPVWLTAIGFFVHFSPLSALRTRYRGASSRSAARPPNKQTTCLSSVTDFPGISDSPTCKNENSIRPVTRANCISKILSIS